MIFLLFWLVSLASMMLAGQLARNPTTGLVPRPLRHTWFAGTLAISSVYMGLAAPYAAYRETLLLIISFTAATIFLGTAGKAFFLVVIYDLRIHVIEGRNAFKHSEDCYMVGGRRHTFLDKAMLLNMGKLHIEHKQRPD